MISDGLNLSGEEVRMRPGNGYRAVFTSEEACSESIRSCENCTGFSLTIVSPNWDRRALEPIEWCKASSYLTTLALRPACNRVVPYLVNTCFEESPGFDAPAPILNGLVVRGTYEGEPNTSTSKVLAIVKFVFYLRRRALLRL